MIGMVLNYLLFALIVFGFVFAAAYLVGRLYYGRHRGVSREEFIRAFQGSEVPSEIPAVVYDFYKSQAPGQDNSVSPDDEYSDLVEGDAEIAHDAESLMEKLKLQPPTEELQLQWIQQVIASRRAKAAPGTGVDSTPILTLRDMVLWLDWLRQHQPQVVRTSESETQTL
jgi:hypothetical protein